MWRKVSIAVVVCAIGLYHLWIRYWWYLPKLISYFTLHVGSHRPSFWEHQLQQGECFQTRTKSSLNNKPNVLFIVADDLGFNDISFYGGGIAGLPTPNIDSIGWSGVGFANGYAGHATCAPSRAAIMTGS